MASKCQDLEAKLSTCRTDLKAKDSLATTLQGRLEAASKQLEANKARVFVYKGNPTSKAIGCQWVCVCVCLFVCLLPNFTVMVNPNELKFSGMISDKANDTSDNSS